MLEGYEKMTVGQQNNFSSICNRLLATTFLSRDKKDNKEDYYFLVSFKDVFEDFFTVLNYELYVNSDEGVAMLKGGNSLSTLKLKRDETVVLLILRILYYENLKNTSLNENVICEVSEIHKKYDYLEIRKKINKTELVRDLRLFKRYNLIEVIGDITTSKCKLVILPTILLAINVENITSVYEEVKNLTVEDGANNEKVN